MKRKLYVIVDMQKDFKDGCLGTKEAVSVAKKIPVFLQEEKAKAEANGEYMEIVGTKDTHDGNYLNTQEGQKLKIPHTIIGTDGWQLVDELSEMEDGMKIFLKGQFGCPELWQYIREGYYDEVVFCGVCTCLCVISNVLGGKAFAPETEFTVVENLCACTCPETHKTGIDAMRVCQTNIVTWQEPDEKREV